jgi:hypothetical protein
MTIGNIKVSGLMTKKIKIGRLLIYVGASNRWGVELTYEPGWSLVVHVVNLWVCVEWWPHAVLKDDGT